MAKANIDFQWNGVQTSGEFFGAVRDAMPIAARLLVSQARANLSGHKAKPGEGHFRRPGAMRDALSSTTWEAPDGNFGALVAGEFPTFQVDKGHKTYKGRSGRRENREQGKPVKGLHHVTNAVKQQKSNIVAAIDRRLRARGFDR